MSRYYSMQVTVEKFDPEKQQDILEAIDDLWNVEQNWSDPQRISTEGRSSLSGGESEEQFADRLYARIAEVNGGPCLLVVGALYLEGYEFHHRGA